MRRGYDHKSGEIEKRRRAEGAEMVPDDITLDDIDPADFFDPEEFGYRRSHDSSR
jgi:hypothetical protein